ncbi:hypothetical protein CBLAS_0166 [Campylobacter blaseri]|uniref:Uncharacterized protein n=1 Tax=Campylobacter blaseri TaxID=2042961 RepID=A0A2P8R0Z7_9BACT|nr:hypothetical protein [Campylobacter blaseri]PSM52174.1 hypothetical protein CQ405_03730 [Campylobacter blaseri]PSM53940.1 hypothetical protein CRN67_03730 [Campylobacter blaseri]QKF85376.1 hypothetical protein CBLAS_0166 [Campylobacter blaseri]
MSIDTIIILGLCVVLFLMLILFYIKDEQTNKRFDRYDQIISDNMAEIFTLKKSLESLNEIVDDLDIGDFSEQIDAQIDKKINPTLESLKDIESLIRQL